jgi:predicted DNA-binding transcriptional regulator AlpA
MTEQSTTIPNVSDERNRSLAELLEQLARIISARVYSPRIRLLNVDQVSEATGYSKRTIAAKVAAGTFPKPQKDSDGKNMWREAALIAWAERNDPNVEKDEA